MRTARAPARRGATIVSEPTTTDYGDGYWVDRSYEAIDLEGHHWWFMTADRGQAAHVTPDLDRTFSALADPTRRGVIEHAAQRTAPRERPRGVRCGASKPAMSRHLRVLRTAGLVETRSETARSDARERIYALRAGAVRRSCATGSTRSSSSGACSSRRSRRTSSGQGRKR